MKRPLCWLLGSALLLTGCASDEPFYDAVPETDDAFYLEETVEEEEVDFGPSLPVTFALPYSKDNTLDPITCSTGMQQTLGSLLYEGLFALDQTFVPQPSLATSYTYDQETLTYTITLRAVLFSDGTPLTAEDVVATLVRAKSSERYGARLADVVAVKALDGQVSITLNRDNAQFVTLLDIPVVKINTEQDAFPIGTGPYAPSEDGTYLEGNVFWWQKFLLPVETIYLSDCANQDLMQYRFTTHDVQLIATDLISTDPIQASGNISYNAVNTTIMHYIGFNMTEEFQLQRTQVRQAFSLGIDRSSVISAFLSGHGLSTQFPLSPLSPYYPHTADITYSKSDYIGALGATGIHANDQTYTLIVNAENSFKVAAASDIASNLSQGNVTVKVQPLSWEEYVLALETGDYDMYYGEVQLTADWDWSALLGTDGALNYGGYSSSAMDEAIQTYLNATDADAAMEALCQVFQAEMPIVPLCFKSTAVLAQSQVLESNTHTQANPFYQFYDWVINLEE